MITAITFVVLTAAIWLFEAVTLDQQAFDAVIALATPGVVRVMKIVNYGGEKLVLIPAMVLLYAVFHARAGSGGSGRRSWWRRRRPRGSSRSRSGAPVRWARASRFQAAT